MFTIGKAVLWESLLHFFHTRADTTTYTIPECVQCENLDQMIDTLKFDGINELGERNRAEKKPMRKNTRGKKGRDRSGRRVSKKRVKKREESSGECSWSEADSSE